MNAKPADIFSKITNATSKSTTFKLRVINVKIVFQFKEKIYSTYLYASEIAPGGFYSGDQTQSKCAFEKSG